MAQVPPEHPASQYARDLLAFCRREYDPEELRIRRLDLMSFLLSNPRKFTYGPYVFISY